jgi:hypothetical protein
MPIRNRVDDEAVSLFCLYVVVIFSSYSPCLNDSTGFFIF